MIPLLKTLLFTVAVPGTVTVALPWWILQRSGSPPVTPPGAPGAVPIGIGAAIYLWCAWDFAVTGRGTPAPIDPPKELVLRGMYRHVRNPMYVAVLLVLFGEAWLFRAPALLGYAAAVWGVFQAFVLWYEEPALERQFGDAYRRYRQEVPRWIPRVGR